jgi:hypothetical protein
MSNHTPSPAVLTKTNVTRRRSGVPPRGCLDPRTVHKYMYGYVQTVDARYHVALIFVQQRHPSDRNGTFLYLFLHIDRYVDFT